MIECQSCHTKRPESEMIPARDFFWRELPGQFVCRDADACFEAFKQLPLS